MIEVKDLTKTFGDKTVLDKINMVLRQERPILSSDRVVQERLS